MKICNAPTPCYCAFLNLPDAETQAKDRNCNFAGHCVYQRPLCYIDYTMYGTYIYGTYVYCLCHLKGQLSGIMTCPIHG